ncbi:hypothetical protein B0J14DRAFT_569108 [Halenospora varia]|nr:hypothetical protein B0J14DRAFT_569108 [Halenospora varia]
MAEAIALLGAVAAGVQCAQVKFIKRSEVDLSPSSFQLQQPLSSSSSSARTAGNWIEAALLECTSQAQTLRDILKDMLQEVDDGKREKIWKKILTVKREQRATTALQEIERQKSMLNMWLGLNNLHQLRGLHHSIAGIHDGMGKVDGNILHVDQTVHQEFQGLSAALNSSSKITASGFDSLTKLSTSNVEALTQQMQRYHGELRSESSAMQLQLRSIEHEEKHILGLNTSTNPKSRRKKGCYNTTPQTCACLAVSQLRMWSVGLNPRATVIHRKMHAEGCPAYTSTKSYSAAIRYHVQSTVLKSLVKLSFQATCGAGGLSIGVSLRMCRRIQKHPLDSFFKDLYHLPRRHRHMYSKTSDNKRTRDDLLRLTRRELMRTFNAGIASPEDVDYQGRNLVHLQLHYAKYPLGTSDLQLAAQVIHLLKSMGAKSDSVDHYGRTPLENVLETGKLRSQDGSYDSYGNILEWTGITSNYFLNGSLMFECMRTWPESREESFISRGMEPVEKTSRRLTPLHLAAAAHWPEAVELLLANGADKHAQDSELCLPIDLAIQANCLQSVALLLSGDCELQFTTHRKYIVGNFPAQILHALFWTNEDIREILLQALIRLQHSLGALTPYHVISVRMPSNQPGIYAAEKLLSAGFIDLELRNEIGNTALMEACWRGRLQYAGLLIEKGANVLTPHRDSAITAGFFLVQSRSLLDCKNIESKPCRRLLQTGFDVSGKVESYCLCSPRGFTPVAVLNRPYHHGDIRLAFTNLMLCLQWPLQAVEQQVRAFALGELFNRLQMTHTCIDIRNPAHKILEEDRLEIESEEDEFYSQLQELMEEYDLRRIGFSGGPLEYLDWFLEDQEFDLPHISGVYCGKRSSPGFNLLGPGPYYQSCRKSFTGRDIYYGHKEAVTEENMLFLLFN